MLSCRQSKKQFLWYLQHSAHFRKLTTLFYSADVGIFCFSCFYRAVNGRMWSFTWTKLSQFPEVCSCKVNGCKLHYFPYCTLWLFCVQSYCIFCTFWLNALETSLSITVIYCCLHLLLVAWCTLPAMSILILHYVPNHREGGNKRCFCPSISPSVCPSVAYISNSSRTQRPSVPKFRRKVPHLRCNLHTSFKVKRP